MIRTLLALSMLLCVAAAPAVAAEPGAPPVRGGQVAAPEADYAELVVRTATGLEVLDHLGVRVPLTGTGTTQSCPLPPPPSITPRIRAGQVTSLTASRPHLRLPCGDHPPYLPTAPPTAG